MHPYIQKIKNSDGGGILISDILTKMLVPPFSLEILRKLPYFVFFTTKSLWNFLKLSKINLNYIHVINNPKLTWQANLLFGAITLSTYQNMQKCRKDRKHINISFFFYKKSTKYCRSVVNFLLNSCANLWQNSHVINNVFYR